MNAKLALATRRLVCLNRRLAREVWGAEVGRRQARVLQELAESHGLSVARAEVQLLSGNWYVTHKGLLCIAHRNRCLSVRVQAVREFCDPASNRWVFKATAYRSSGCKGFVGYGDADPSNVSPLVRGAEMRVAETRAVNRALRKAYGIGLCSVEELGWAPRSSGTDKANQSPPSSVPSNGQCNNGQPRLRDRLCLLIRQHQLDANLVKAYAADFLRNTYPA